MLPTFYAVYRLRKITPAIPSTLNSMSGDAGQAIEQEGEVGMQEGSVRAPERPDLNARNLLVSQTIFTHAARISREWDISKLLLLNADLARDLTGGERCSLWLVDQAAQQLWTKVAHGVSEIRIPLGSGIVGACVARDESIVVNNAETDPRFLRTVDQTSGYLTKSVLAVPLRADGRVIGALQVLNKPGGFDSHDVEVLSLMALYSASEIQSEQLRGEVEAARLIKREMELAREVQQNLLPQRVQNIEGLEVGSFFRPAKSVGGDYFDFLPLHDGLFSFTVGDVSGKGLAAAVLMASIQTLLRSHFLRQAFPLDTLVAEVSHTIYRCSSPERYSTLFCGVIDQDRRTMTYVNAGHVTPILVRGKTGQIERPESAGLPIGILPTARYQAETVQLAQGDTVVCVSDGMCEVMNKAGEMWDEREIEATVERAGDATVNNLVEALVKRADEYAAGTDQYDDMTIAVVRVTA
jgi:phosphoserine phosphatase RsbU/P